MAELLLINPKKRRAPRRKSSPKRARRNPIRVAVRRAPARRRNPIRNGVRARRNPIRIVARRRRNPIGLGSVRGMGAGLLGSIKGALIGGAGAVAVDVAYGQIAPMLPASMRRTPGQVGAGDAVKVLFTYALGRLLKGATRGLSERMAAGALTVQASDILRTFVPSSMTLGRLAYYSPAVTSSQPARVPGNMRTPAFVSPGAPQLGMYTRPVTLGSLRRRDALATANLR